MNRNWGRLSPDERSVAFHEAGHGVMAETLGWRVRDVRVGKNLTGLCRYTHSAPAPWVDLIVSAAGHSAEEWRSGWIVDPLSESDRESGRKVLDMAGAEGWISGRGVREVESLLWPVWDWPPIAEALRTVARGVGERRFLTRAEFLRLAAPAFKDYRLIREVRRYCERLALDVLRRHTGIPIWAVDLLSGPCVPIPCGEDRS